MVIKRNEIKSVIIISRVLRISAGQKGLLIKQEFEIKFECEILRDFLFNISSKITFVFFFLVKMSCK